MYCRHARWVGFTRNRNATFQTQSLSCLSGSPTTKLLSYPLVSKWSLDYHVCTQSPQHSHQAQQQQPGSAQSQPQSNRQTESLPGVPQGQAAGQRLGPARLWENAKRQAGERHSAQPDAPNTPSSAPDGTAQHGELLPSTGLPYFILHPVLSSGPSIFLRLQ